jgi:hypothetical protein
MKLRKIIIQISNILASDIYRAWVFVKEIFSDRKNAIDVVFITNFQNNIERGFMGSLPLLRNKPFVYSLKFKMKNDKIGRIITINSLSENLIKNIKTRKFNNFGHLARFQVREAIDDAVQRGARVVLFGASTKRLFDTNELAELDKKYKQVVFTIGDNGTVIQLWNDVKKVMKVEHISKKDKILIIGPNGFLGNAIKIKLQNRGYSNLDLVSQTDKVPFEKSEKIKLIIACSHHKKVRLTKKIIQQIAEKNGIFVVDVSRPYNFSKKEFNKCLRKNIKVKRIDAGNSYNKNLCYDGGVIANIALNQIGLSQKRLFGCFSEASSLVDYPYDELVKYDFLSVNNQAINFINKSFKKTDFETSHFYNFGKK